MKIIAMQGAANKGKTSTIRNAYERFKTRGRIELFQPIGNDLEAIITMPDNKKIGFYSQGDCPENTLHNIETAEKWECDILVTAVRTKGGTVDVINKYCFQNTNNEVLLLGVIDMWTDSNPASAVYDNISGNNSASISSISAQHLLNVIEYVMQLI